MPCSRNHSLALVFCCCVAGFAAGDLQAQGMTPLRVDPVLLGLPPAEKKPPPTVPTQAKPVEAPVERAQVKPVDAQSVEAKPLSGDAEATAETAPVAEGKAKASTKPARASASASPDQIPARAVAPAAAAVPVVAAPAPSPKSPQSATPVVAAPASRAREREVSSELDGAPKTSAAVVPRGKTAPALPVAASKSTAPGAAAAGSAAVAVPLSSTGGKVTTLEALRVHPGLLGLPVTAVAGEQAPPARVLAAPVMAAPAPRPREQEASSEPDSAPKTPAVATHQGKTAPALPVVASTPLPASATRGMPTAAPSPVAVPLSSTGGKVTTLEPLRVHPGLLGLPVGAVAGESAPSARVLAARAAQGAAYSPPATLAGLGQAREDAWRAGHPPVLTFDTAAPVLLDSSSQPLPLRTDKTLEPIQSGGAAVPMFLTADQLAGVTDHEAEAFGDAEARQGRAVVKADRMIYWPVEDELEATGNVRMASGDDYITGPHMRMKLGEQTGVFDQPEYFLKRESAFAKSEQKRQEKGTKGSAIVSAAGAAGQMQKVQMSRPEEGSLMNVLGISSEEPGPLPLTEARGNAERIDFEGENKLRIIKGNYTTCKPGDTGWYIKSDEIALDYDRQVGDSQNTTLYFQNTPIFYSPSLSFSLNNERKSGFLAPTFGSSSVNGLMLTTPYYWNIAPNMDATFAPRYFGKRGEQLGSELRYLDPNFLGNVRGEYMAKDRLDDDNDRWAYSLRHQQNFGYGLSGNLNIAGVSDDKYFTDLGSRSVLTSQRQLLRQGTLAYGGDWWGATVMGQSYQTLNPDPTQTIAKPYTLAPQATVNARRPDFYRTDAAFFGQYTSFKHDSLDQGQRTVAYPSLSMPFVQPGWYVTPKIGQHITSYSLDRRTTTGPDSITRSLPVFSVDAGMTFERDTSWFGAKATQTLEPRLYYLSVPYKDQSQIPVFDSAVADFNFATIFSENQFLGYDRFSDANQLTAAVTSRLVDPTSGAEAMRAMIGQRFYFQRQRVTLNSVQLPTADQGKWQKSDFLTAFSGRVLPKTYVDAALQYNPHDSRMERSSVGARYQPELGKVLNASYRYASSAITSGALKNVDVAGQWPIWGGWSAVGRYNYSMLDHKPVETVGGLEYNAGCWAIRLVGHQVVTTEGRTNTSFFVQLELNDFARIGSNPIDLLRRNVQGYGLANQPIADPVFGE